MSTSRLVVMATLIALCLLPSLAQAHRTQRVTFDPGTTGTHLWDGVARGETMTYLLGARAGQKMRISVESVESNAVFSVIAPSGAHLGESHFKEGFQVWFGSLPQSGDYKIVVGSSRGGAEYTITMNIF